MKKRTLLLLVCIVVITGLYFAPKLLNQKHFQDRITRELISSFGVDLRFSDIQFKWLPIPALYIEDISSESDVFSLKIPQVQFIPDIRSFFTDQSHLGRLKLIKPNLHLKPVKTGSNTPTPQIPDLKLTISDGTITVPQKTIKPLGTSIVLQPLTINHINLKTAFSKNRLKFNGEFQSSLSSKTEAIGRMDINKNYYRIDLKATDANLAPLLNQADSNFQIEDSKISLQAHFEGLGLDNFKLNLSEINRPLTFQLQGHDYKVSSIGTIGLTRHENEFFMEFDHFTFKEPSASFSGKISRRNGETPEKPIWILDISGSEIDLGSVRKRILTLWPENEAAVETCEIVLGGFAKTARYVFKGPVEDFHSLENMKIWAEAVNVPLYIPDISLDIDQASGPISIINGYLSGKNLQADIVSSHGKNASLWLDLIGQDDAFYLDIDLDADLQDLQDVLTTIIANPTFENELEQFSQISGRAKGKLTLGSSLHELDTTVQVNFFSAEGFYDRLPWPFKIDGIKLDIFPNKVLWKDVQASIGQQSIKKISGNVKWDKEEVTVSINHLDASADLKSLFNESFLLVNGNKSYLKNSFAEVLTDITGSAEFTDTQFSGPAMHPDKWHFETSFTLSNTTLRSPYLPPNIVSEVVQGSLTSEELNFSGIFDTFDQNIFISGNYNHTLLDNWLGKIELNGSVKHKLGEWVRSTKWIPTEYFPRLPLTLNNFKITNKSPKFEYFDIKGEIITRNNQVDVKSMILDISKQKNIALNIVSFNDGLKQGKFSYMFQPNSERSLLTWQGELNMATLDAFFEKNIFQAGTLNGVFSRLSSKQHPEQTTYAGYLEADDLTWSYFPESKPIIAKNVHINGENSTIHFKEFSTEIDGDILYISGKINDTGQSFDVDVTMTSKEVTLNKIRHAFNQHKNYIESTFSQTASETKTDNKIATTIFDKITGKIDYNFNHLNYITAPRKSENSQPADELPHTLTLNNPYGNIELSPQDIKVQLFPADLCGMKMSGTYFSNLNKNDSFFDITTGNSSLRFEEVLPCLGQKKNLITGPFKAKGHLDGTPGNWHGGELTLTSEEGIIKKMHLLSKIFSVVNFTELFAWGNPPDLEGKGLMYSDLIIKSHVKENKLNFDRAVLKGKGVNLTGRGTIDLADTDFSTDMTFFVAPFKMIDTVVTNVPLVGKALGGKKESILTFPVGVSGPLRDPETTALPPSAIGSAAIEFIVDTLTLPFRILIPDLKKSKEEKPSHDDPLKD